MEISQAIDVLTRFQAWRRGDGSEMIAPSLVGEAIDVVLEYLSEQT